MRFELALASLNNLPPIVDVLCRVAMLVAIPTNDVVAPAANEAANLAVDEPVARDRPSPATRVREGARRRARAKEISVSFASSWD